MSRYVSVLEYHLESSSQVKSPSFDWRALTREGRVQRQFRPGSTINKILQETSARSNSHALFAIESEDMAEQVHLLKKKLPSPGKKHNRSNRIRKPFGHLVHLNTNPS
jgi:hypothetical protein